MNRRVVAVALPLLLLLLLPNLSPAQRIFFGAGATLPNGDYGEFAKTGWMANAGVGFAIPNSRAGVTFSAFYGMNSHDDVDGDKTNLYGAMGSLRYAFHEPTRPGLFVNGGIGLLVHSYKSDLFPSAEESETQFAYHAGVGVDIPLSSVSLYGLAGYMGGDTTFLRFMAGISIPIGGN
jgi:hypothetical protein